MTASTLGETFIRWAQAEPTVELLVLIGSRTRAAGDSAAADQYSDWDFQIATSNPGMFAERAWTATLGLRPVVYVARLGRLGSTQKVTALFAEGELDLVLIPVGALRDVAQLAKGAPQAAPAAVPQPVTDLAAVLQGGYRIVKGAAEFAEFYAWVTREIPPARLPDDAIRRLADGFVCDYLSTLRKIDRGELLAAQRWLHHQLAETNFKLLHELRQRQGATSFPDARWLERLREPRTGLVSVEAIPNPASLRAAAGKSAAGCRELVHALVGGGWQWPDLAQLRLRAE